MPVHPFIKLTILFNSRLKRSRIIQNPCRHPLAYSLRAYGVPIMYFIETINPDATTDSKTILGINLYFIITKPSPQSTITTKDQIETIAGIWIG